MGHKGLDLFPNLKVITPHHCTLNVCRKSCKDGENKWNIRDRVRPNEFSLGIQPLSPLSPH